MGPIKPGDRFFRVRHLRGRGVATDWTVAMAWPHPKTDGIMGANARLIAAEPELYEALASLMTAVDYTQVLKGDKAAEIKSRALAALAKARGESQ